MRAGEPLLSIAAKKGECQFGYGVQHGRDKLPEG